MRSDRYANEQLNEAYEPTHSSEPEDAYTEEATSEPTGEQDTSKASEVVAQFEEEAPKKRFGRRSKKERSNASEAETDLSKLKKKDLLEIMLAQSKEIDSLRAQVAELEAKLADREFEFNKIGSIAEASLAVTNIFKEAEEAAKVYLYNIRRRCEERTNEHSGK